MPARHHRSGGVPSGGSIPPGRVFRPCPRGPESVVRAWPGPVGPAASSVAARPSGPVPGALPVDPLELALDVGPDQRLAGVELLLGPRGPGQHHGPDDEQDEQHGQLRDEPGDLLVVERSQADGGMGPGELRIERSPREDEDEREECRDHRLGHQVAEPDHRLRSGDAGYAPEHRHPQHQAGHHDDQVEHAPGDRRRRLGPDHHRRHRADHQHGDGGDGHRGPLQAR